MRAYQWIMVAVVGFVAGLAGATLGRQPSHEPRAPSAPAAIKASTIEIVDARGITRAMLSERGLLLSDSTDVLRVAVVLSPDGKGGFGLLDAEGNLRAEMALEGGTPSLVLNDAAGDPKVMAVVLGGGKGGVATLAADGSYTGKLGIK